MGRERSRKPPPTAAFSHFPPPCHLRTNQSTHTTHSHVHARPHPGLRDDGWSTPPPQTHTFSHHSGGPRSRRIVLPHLPFRALRHHLRRNLFVPFYFFLCLCICAVSPPADLQHCNPASYFNENACVGHRALTNYCTLVG